MITTQYKDITYKSERDLWTLETDIFFIINWKWEAVWFNYQNDIIKVNENVQLYKLWLSNYLLELLDINYLNSFKERLLSDWVEILWSFEKNWKFYLILYKTDIEWWINLEILSKWNKIEDETKITAWKIDWIL